MPYVHITAISVSLRSSWLYCEILKWMTYLCLSLPPLVHNEFSCEYETLIWFLSMVHIHYKYLFRRKNKQVGKYVAKNWKWKKLHWFCMVKYDIYFESFHLVISWKIKLLFLKNVIWSLIFTIFCPCHLPFQLTFPKVWPQICTDFELLPVLSLWIWGHIGVEVVILF